MHVKVLIDDNLMARDCNISSMCNLCFKHVESSFHIFFNCPYALKIWSWLAYVINLTMNFTWLEDIRNFFYLSWSPQ